MGDLKLNYSVGFSIQNVYAITIWLIKNAGDSLDEQIKSFYLDTLATEDNIKGYIIPFAISDEAIEILGIYKHNVWEY